MMKVDRKSRTRGRSMMLAAAAAVVALMAGLTSFAVSAGCGPADDGGERTGPEGAGGGTATDAFSESQSMGALAAGGGAGQGPYYFIAIHCEPAHGRPGQQQEIATNYQTLQEMVARADQYGIKLTLMFSPPWADYITASPERMAEVERWRMQGHEIAAHHHSIYHGNWDGYTDYPEEVYARERAATGRRRPAGLVEPYLGSLDDYTESLRRINPEMESGCLNEEQDKAEMPDAFIYSSCSGYSNRDGAEQAKDGDRGDTAKGVNEFVLTGVWDGIERKWLSHFQITEKRLEEAAEVQFSSLESGVYGVVTHAVSSQAVFYYDFLDYLHSLDEDGSRSRTLSGAIKEGLLPEREVAVSQFK